ncbi:MAG TPA: ABC transporter substrate-binding protein [Streptosporangiaceae bacterium]
MSLREQTRTTAPRREKDGGFLMRAGRAAWRPRKLIGGPIRGGRGRRLLATCCTAVGLTVLAAACGPASATSGGAGVPADTSTVTYALPPTTQATYIFPFVAASKPGADFSVYNVNDFQYLMYRPLYWFGTGVNPYMNPDLSLAYPPTYSGNQLTIRLKTTYKWSNGEPVDAQDVVFWMNMMAAEDALGNGYIGESPGGLPGEVTNVRAVSQYEVTMTIKGSYSETWFSNNQLSQITPMPEAWDRTAAGPSHCSTNVADCDAVYKYLDQQAGSVSSYGTSALWGVVDGPWKVQSLNSQGNLTMLFNDKYSGPVAPHHITKLIEVPFTTEGAEYNVLQDPSGSQVIDFGYLPTVDAPVPPAGATVGTNPSSLSGYSLGVVYPWEIAYFPYDFNNPKSGPIFKQLYFRQAFQELVDQEGVIDGPLHGYGKPGIGPVADYPVTSYLSPTLAKNGDPWTLNIPAARAALASHGWKQLASGQPMTCVNAGSGPRQCGAGVAAGAVLNFNFIYASGQDFMESAARELESNASLAGIQINLTAESFDDVVGAAFDPTNTSWDLAEWGAWTYDPDYLPTGETLFETNALNNAGGYTDLHNDSLINATLDARTPSAFTQAMYAWQNYEAAQLPVVYMPIRPVLNEVIKGLDIGVQNSALMITPEMWFYR